MCFFLNFYWPYFCICLTGINVYYVLPMCDVSVCVQSFWQTIQTEYTLHLRYVCAYIYHFVFTHFTFIEWHTRARCKLCVFAFVKNVFGTEYDVYWFNRCGLMPILCNLLEIFVTQHDPFSLLMHTIMHFYSQCSMQYALLRIFHVV